MSILVLKPGLFDTIQDTGRHGYSCWGINEGGAMDQYAAQVANILVGNEQSEAVIEIYFPSIQIQFQRDALITITGTDFTPTVNSSHVIPGWKPVWVKKDTVLTFRHKNQGNCCYLAVHGGFDLLPWFGSYSTNIKIGSGGFHGRSLQKGDVLKFKEGPYSHHDLRDKEITELPWMANHNPVYSQKNDISFIEGNEWNWLAEASQQQILSQEFKIDPASDRMGYYLRQDPFKFEEQYELLSSAVTAGTIQALPNGNVVILMADHQTTGGYPRLGHVATAHLPKLAQLTPHEPVYFNKISLDAAEKMLFSLQQELRLVQRACHEKLKQYHAER